MECEGDTNSFDDDSVNFSFCDPEIPLNVCGDGYVIFMKTITLPIIHQELMKRSRSI